MMKEEAKKLGDYCISYCPSEYFGKSLHGQVRSGYKTKENRPLMFRIAHLPLTAPLSAFFQLQKQMASLPYARSIESPVESSTNHYLPMEFFPKTFETEKATFRTNPRYHDQYIEKFLRVYAFFYNMRVAHGNLTANNVGITFDGRVKLMDFVPSDSPFHERQQQDFQDFKTIIGRALQKDDNFPAKFSVFNKPENETWQKLFSSWHVTSPLQPLYLERKHHLHNRVTLLHKLAQNLQNPPDQLRLAIRLLMLYYMKSSKDEELKGEADNLQMVMGKLEQFDLERANSDIMGAIRDPHYYSINPSQRLLLICSLLPRVNHQYLYYEILAEMASQEAERDRLLADSLLATYKADLFRNLIRSI